MSRTNSNSITSILIYFLNNNTIVRKNLIEMFNATEKIVSSDVCFYDGTHSPLELETMNNKQVDIYARVPGKYKINLMIEVKAGIYEDLQDSQKEGGEYQNTSKKEKIPLIFIIPKRYSHINEIPESVRIIYWEDILVKCSSENKEFSKQIEHFVDVSNENRTPKAEGNKIYKKFMDLKEYIKSRYEFKKNLTEALKISEKTFSETGDEFGYYWENGKHFMGISYFKDNFEEKYVLGYFILEDKKNTELGKKDFYFLDGWYFIPIQPNKKQKSINDLSRIKDKKYLMKINVDLLNKKLKDFSIDNQSDCFYLLELLKNLYEDFLEKEINLYEKTDWYGNGYQNDEYGIGYYFKERKNKKRTFFIGISPQYINEKYWFSIAVQFKKGNKPKTDMVQEDWAFFPLDIERLSKCKSEEELQEKFNKNLAAAIKNIK